MAKRSRRKRSGDESMVWSCKTCISQFFGGERCKEHNPTPEERDAHPELYVHEAYMPARNKV